VQALVASHVTYGALLMQKGASLKTKVTTEVTESNWSTACLAFTSPLPQGFNLTSPVWNSTYSVPSKRIMRLTSRNESSTLFDFAALRNYEVRSFTFYLDFIFTK
jgi:hypothetical protein